MVAIQANMCYFRRYTTDTLNFNFGTVFSFSFAPFSLNISVFRSFSLFEKKAISLFFLLFCNFCLFFPLFPSFHFLLPFFPSFMQFLSLFLLFPCSNFHFPLGHTEIINFKQASNRHVTSGHKNNSNGFITLARNNNESVQTKSENGKKKNQIRTSKSKFPIGSSIERHIFCEHIGMQQESFRDTLMRMRYRIFPSSYHNFRTCLCLFGK